MSQLRSETMALFQVTMQKDHDWTTVNQLCTQNDYLHFVGLNEHVPPHHLSHYDVVRSCDESLKRIAFIEDMHKRYAVPMTAPANFKKFQQDTGHLLQLRNLAEHQLYPSVAEDTMKQAEFMRQQNQLIEDATRDFVQTLCRINLCKAVASMFLGRSAAEGAANSKTLKDIEGNDLQEPLLGGVSSEILEQTHMVYYGGVIDIKEIHALKLLLFRATRGKVLLQTFDLHVDEEDRVRGENFDQVLQGYIIMFEMSKTMQRIVERVCQSFNTNGGQFAKSSFQITPRTVEQDLKLAVAEKVKLRDLISHSKQTFYDYLTQWVTIERVSMVKLYKQIVMRERAISTLLNKCKQNGQLLVGLVWIPEEKVPEFLQVSVQTESGANIPLVIKARQRDDELYTPTFNKSTDFADVNQKIVDTYGVPLYKEANPAVFTCVTFPFLFGVMFGDIMHGSMLLAASLGVLIMGRKNVGEQVWGMRWMLLLMGIFATYCGWIYNDFGSIPVYTFPSCYEYSQGQAAPQVKEGCVYPAGVDPAWYLSTAELTYANSLKMKLSVIFGVGQMTIGILLKGSNCAYSRRWVDFFFEFIPQLLTLLCLFGYMDYLIIAKWLTNWDGETQNSPSIISIMIDMCLSQGKPQTPGELPIVAGSAQVQMKVENILVLIVLVCVPTMLCVKPCVFGCCFKPKDHHQHGNQKEGEVAEYEMAAMEDFVPADKIAQMESAKQQQQQESMTNAEDEFDLHKNIVLSAGPQDHHGGDFGELMIHQMIETIEFVLGTVSNTASYLRLWALSLAHSQLAKVFFDMCLVSALTSGSYVMLYLGFFVFIGATMSVLMCMDLLECCLHTLRLHWVEFQSKFFKGGGIPFAPTVLTTAVSQEA